MKIDPLIELFGSLAISMNNLQPNPNPNPEPNPAPNPIPNGRRFAIDPNLNFHERGRIPAIVTDLPEYTGNPRNLAQWILDVEDILELFDDGRDTFQYHLIIKTIRRKIKNEASDVLVTNNIPVEWEAMKECLRLYYADKRDLMTLDSQLKAMSKAKYESIETYYSRVTEMVTLISSAINMNDQWRGHETALIKLYNMIALDTFIRGLGEPLSLFCKNYRPNNLAQAYHYCVEYLNLSARNAPFSAQTPLPLPAPRSNLPTKPHNPPIPPRNLQPRTSSNFQTSRPPVAPLPRSMPSHNLYPPQQNNVFAHKRTFVQPQPKPEPMDTSSIRTQQINYGNRPIAQRRHASESMRVHEPSAKRMANILEECVNPEEYEKWYNEQLDLSKEFFGDEECLEPLENLNLNDDSDIQATQNADQPEETNFLEETDWVTKWF